jgi:hypothetical protein
VAVNTDRRSPESILVPGLYASIQQRRAQGECHPDPRFDDIADDDTNAAAAEVTWRERCAQAALDARRLADNRIREGKPIRVMSLQPGLRPGGVFVPSLPLLTEGYPLCVMPDDMVEIDTDATPERRCLVNAERCRRCHSPITGLDRAGWQAEVRKRLTNGGRHD